jgi:hypothetical protein
MNEKSLKNGNIDLTNVKSNAKHDISHNKYF